MTSSAKAWTFQSYCSQIDLPKRLGWRRQTELSRTPIKFKDKIVQSIIANSIESCWVISSLIIGKWLGCKIRIKNWWNYWRKRRNTMKYLGEGWQNLSTLILKLLLRIIKKKEKRTTMILILNKHLQVILITTLTWRWLSVGTFLSWTSNRNKDMRKRSR